MNDTQFAALVEGILSQSFPDSPALQKRASALVSAPLRSSLLKSNANDATWHTLAKDPNNKDLLMGVACCLRAEPAASLYRIATTIFTALANHDHIDALCNLAWCKSRWGGVAGEREAVQLYEKARNAGSSAGAVALAACLATGRGCTRDIKKADELISGALDNADAQFLRARQLMDHANPGQEALELLHSAAKVKHAGACFELGNVLLGSLQQPFPAELVSAFRAEHPNLLPMALWETAGQAGHPLALYNLACSYRQDDRDKAMEYMRKAAQRGYARAQMSLGADLVMADGHETEGAQLLLQAAESGLALAQLKLSHCFSTGRGVTKNDKLALKWVAAAAARGLPAAQYHLGRKYLEGESGLTHNPKTALLWLELAADNGHTQSHALLAEYYRKVEALPELAWEHAIDAANAGSPLGMKNAAVCLESGIGVEADAEEAKRWREKAASVGNAEPTVCGKRKRSLVDLAAKLCKSTKTSDSDTPHGGKPGVCPFAH